EQGLDASRVGLNIGGVTGHVGEREQLGIAAHDFYFMLQSVFTHGAANGLGGGRRFHPTAHWGPRRFHPIARNPGAHWGPRRLRPSRSEQEHRRQNFTDHVWLAHGGHDNLWRSLSQRLLVAEPAAVRRAFRARKVSWT